MKAFVSLIVFFAQCHHSLAFVCRSQTAFRSQSFGQEKTRVVEQSPSVVFSPCKRPKEACFGRTTQSSRLYVVEFFDGSQIVDPVIVSDVFWTKLQSNFLSFIIGQFLAATVFGFFLSVVSTQFGSIVDSIKGALSPKPSTKSPLKIPADLSVDGVAKGSPDIDVKKLAICLLIDIIGTSSEAIPFVGEVTDLVWAPIAATALRSLFGGSNNILFALEFTEEILPFTDILPLATLCWVVETFYEESEVAKVLGLGVYQEGKRG